MGRCWNDIDISNYTRWLPSVDAREMAIRHLAFQTVSLSSPGGDDLFQRLSTLFFSCAGSSMDSAQLLWCPPSGSNLVVCRIANDTKDDTKDTLKAILSVQSEAHLKI